MSPEDELTEALAANAIGAVWNNPMMRLTAISQAAANFAAVAEAAHNIGMSIVTRPVADQPEMKEFCIRVFTVRQTCFDNIIELLKQIKNEPTP